MQKKITFLGREHTPVLDQHIEKQLEKIEQFLKTEPTPIFIDIVVSFHDVHQHVKITARVKTPHFDCFAEHEGPDFFIEVNEVLDRLLDQLRVDKKRLIDHHHRGCDKNCRAAFFKEVEEEISQEDDE